MTARLRGGSRRWGRGFSAGLTGGGRSRNKRRIRKLHIDIRVVHVM